MKNLIKSTLSAVLMTVLGVAMMGAPAHAQVSSRVLVDIPFDFSVGNNTLKAGSYQVQELQSGLLAFTRNDGQGGKFVLTVPGDTANRSQQAHFVFVRYGSEAFLSKVFLSAGDDCKEFSPSKRERELIQGRESGQEVSLLIQPVR